jgi:hypothetical protein
MLERAGELASRNAPTWWNTGVRLAGPMGKEKFLWELFVGGGVEVIWEVQDQQLFFNNKGTWFGWGLNSLN